MAAEDLTGPIASAFSAAVRVRVIQLNNSYFIPSFIQFQIIEFYIECRGFFAISDRLSVTLSCTHTHTPSYVVVIVNSRKHEELKNIFKPVKITTSVLILSTR